MRLSHYEKIQINTDLLLELNNLFTGLTQHYHDTGFPERVAYLQDVETRIRKLIDDEAPISKEGSNGFSDIS